MSVQFGRWNWQGQPIAADYVERVSAFMAPYGPDSCEAYTKENVKILYRAFHTTKESRRETQPHRSPSGVVITWDGRLDNRRELISELGGPLSFDSSDVAIVAAAHENWGASCFARFIGDWAVAIWNAIDCSLILAKDVIGTRPLYYTIDNNQVTWSTILDPLVLFAGRTFKVSEEYIAGCLASFPATHLTPYIGVDAVPPSSSVVIRPGKYIVNQYWDFDRTNRIRYRTDAEYEEHFRSVFAAAVQRRLRSNGPVLAELSGGMDSSSIVCMADILIGRGEAETSRLDTISWYDDVDPGFDERPYFMKVEQKRGRVGYHINLSAQKQIRKGATYSKQCFPSVFDNDRLAATPDSNRRWPPELFSHYAAYMRSQQYRVTLSGNAGEDTTGGYVPTPTPELQNLLSRARFLTLVRQTDAWAAKMGKPRLTLLREAVRGFFSHSLSSPWAPKDFVPPPWLQPSFVERNKAALSWYPARLNLFGALPSFQYQIQLLNHRRRIVAYCAPWPEMPREIRYPYLDRDLLEFVYSIPREQLVGVGKRRFLMKRALVGIVPDELLNRKPRATVKEEPERNTSGEWSSLYELEGQIITSSLGIVDAHLFVDALQKARLKEELMSESLKRALFLECWLHHLVAWGVLMINPIPAKERGRSSLKTNESPTSAQIKSSAS